MGQHVVGWKEGELIPLLSESLPHKRQNSILVLVAGGMSLPHEGKGEGGRFLSPLEDEDVDGGIRLWTERRRTLREDVPCDLCQFGCRLVLCHGQRDAVPNKEEDAEAVQTVPYDGLAS